MDWKAYNELAWVDTILASPESYEDEAMLYIKAINKYISNPAATMLHLGCGAGGHDYHFKKYFFLTGVDLSEGMLNIAKTRNSQVTYIKDDMRTVQLNKKFDIVIIPDSIAYMTTYEDLLKTIRNAHSHMKQKGIIMVVAHMKEDFKNNNFVYTGEKDNINITVFENNHVISKNTYESTIFYLIRANGKTSIHHEIHTLGLFEHDQWIGIFKNNGLNVVEMDLNDLYDKYLLDDGEYKLKIIIGTEIK